MSTSVNNLEASNLAVISLIDDAVAVEDSRWLVDAADAQQLSLPALEYRVDKL